MDSKMIVPTSGNPSFDQVVREALETHKGKSNDYANEDPYSNFKMAAEVANTSVDQVFMVLLGVKMARLRELLTTGKEAINFESVDDTKGDIFVYAGIWKAYSQDEVFGPIDE